MDPEFACVTVAGRPGEAEAAFKSRLVAFWSDYLRSRPDDYEKIFAEASAFETDHDVVSRQYMVEMEGIDAMIAMLFQHGLDFTPVDREDLYTKYEAAPPDWFQLDH